MRSQRTIPALFICIPFIVALPMFINVHAYLCTVRFIKPYRNSVNKFTGSR